MLTTNIKEYIYQFEDKELVFLFLMSLRHDLDFDSYISKLLDKSSLFKLIEDNIIEKDYITSSYKLLVGIYEGDEGNIIPSKNYSDISKEIKENIHNYRNLFKGFRIGSMGNPDECVKRMTQFIIMHNTSFDKVMEATMYYLERENPEYVMNADNFISNEKGSKLAAVLEQMPESKLMI